FLDEDEEVLGEDAPYVKIEYFNNSPIVEYEYDTTNEKYNRISDGVQSLDVATETPIELVNIFIIESADLLIESEGRVAFDLQSGDFGYLLQRGNVQKINWTYDKG